MSKRAQRRFNTQKKYEHRLKKWLPTVNFWKEDKPESWKDLKKHPWSKFLKNTPHPCSCGVCSGEHFDRNKQKHIDNEIVDDALSDRNGWDEIDYWEEEDFYNDFNEYYGQTG